MRNIQTAEVVSKSESGAQAALEKLNAQGGDEGGEVESAKLASVCAISDPCVGLILRSCLV